MRYLLLILLLTVFTLKGYILGVEIDATHKDNKNNQWNTLYDDTVDECPIWY